MTTEPAKAYHKGSENLVHWKPGQSGNPKGRGKGNRNKLGEAFLEALHQDFEANGLDAIVECREKRPEAYLRVIASLIPKDHRISLGDDKEGLTDEQVKDRVRALASKLGVMIGDTDDRVERLRRINAGDVIDVSPRGGGGTIVKATRH